jgi:glycosyltransferase involved in cell wall biosynthesis
MKLSIITINRNNGNGLRQTLASVAEQTFKEFEHIVIDGASTDNSVKVIKNFPHLTYYVSESDNGIYDAMNKGIKQAKGEYCLFLNSGDYLASSIVISEILVHLNGEDIVCGDILKRKRGKTLLKKMPHKVSIDFFVDNSLPHPSAFIKTELLVKLKGYRTYLRIVSDWAFFLEAICKYGASYKYIPIPVSVFIGGGISENFALSMVERDKVWEEVFPDTYNAWKKLFPSPHKNIIRLAELQSELNIVYQIPGVKFLMKYVYPLYKKLRQF